MIVARGLVGGRAADYVSLLKPRIVLLLVITAVASMPMAAHRLPGLLPVLAVAIGGSLAAGGAHAINCWYDRDLDRLMKRTSRRPLAEGRLPAWHALAIGLALNVLAFLVFIAWANLTAALLAMIGSAVYVFVYTVWLKRTSEQNIVIGGSAGAIPPLVGWAATGVPLDLTALSLFLVVLFWTPPHFWSLADLRRDDYGQARLPMLPVVSGVFAARRLSVRYAGLTATASLVPFLSGAAGVCYLLGATALGAAFVVVTWLDLRRSGWTGRAFGFSILYLSSFFVLVGVGPFLP